MVEAVEAHPTEPEPEPEPEPKAEREQEPEPEPEEGRSPTSTTGTAITTTTTTTNATSTTTSDLPAPPCAPVVSKAPQFAPPHTTTQLRWHDGRNFGRHLARRPKVGAFRARTTARRKHKPQDEIGSAKKHTAIATAHEKAAALSPGTSCRDLGHQTQNRAENICRHRTHTRAHRTRPRAKLKAPKITLHCHRTGEGRRATAHAQVTTLDPSGLILRH